MQPSPETFSPGDRRPIKTAAEDLARWIGAAVAVLGIVGGMGLGFLTDEQTTAVTALLDALPGLVGLIGVVLTAFGVVRRSEPLTTPLVDPRTSTGAPLHPSRPQ